MQVIPAGWRMARSVMVVLVLAQRLAAATGPAADIPTLPPPALDAPQVTLHGTWDGQPFWARLLPSDPHFAGHRVLQLLWTPPTPEALGGVHLVDCPFVLLDEQARVVAWNGRDGLSQIVPVGTDSYRVTREMSRASGSDSQPVPSVRTIGGGRGWDLHLTPLLLALSWKAGTSGVVRVIDLYGPHAAEAMSARWHDQDVIIDHLTYHISVDAHGHLQRLTDAHGVPCIDVAARVSEGLP